MLYSRLRSMPDLAFLNVATRIFAEYSSVTSRDASKGSVALPPRFNRNRGVRWYMNRGEAVIRTDSQWRKYVGLLRRDYPPQQPPSSPCPPQPQPSPHSPSCSFCSMGRIVLA